MAEEGRIRKKRKVAAGVLVVLLLLVAGTAILVVPRSGGRGGGGAGDPASTGIPKGSVPFGLAGLQEYTEPASGLPEGIEKIPRIPGRLKKTEWKNLPPPGLHEFEGESGENGLRLIKAGFLETELDWVVPDLAGAGLPLSAAGEGNLQLPLGEPRVSIPAVFPSAEDSFGLSPGGGNPELPAGGPVLVPRKPAGGAVDPPPAPVPEPSTLVLMSASLVFFVLTRFRRG